MNFHKSKPLSLSQIQTSINEAKQEDQAVTGGVLKTLIAVRLEVLNTNQALVTQRIDAIKLGAKVNIVVNGTKPDPDRAAKLAEDIKQQESKVAADKANSDQYTGGLVKGLAETTLATDRQTLALLQQQELAAKYGLAIPNVPSSASAAAKSGPDDQRMKDILGFQMTKITLVLKNPSAQRYSDRLQFTFEYTNQGNLDICQGPRGIPRGRS